MLEFFSRESGRIAAVYRGAKKQRRQKSKPQLFVSYYVELFGTGELKSVANMEADASFQRQSLQGVRLLSGLYVNELLYRLLHAHEKQTEVFQAYEDVLLALFNTSNFEAHLRHFELRLLASLGYGLQFGVEYDGVTPVRADRDYQVLVGSGIHPATATLSEPAVAVPGRVLKDIDAGHWQDRIVLQTLKQINRRALDLTLKGQVLKSRELMRKSLLKQ